MNSLIHANPQRLEDVAQGQHARPVFSRLRVQVPALTEKKIFSATNVEVKTVAGACQCWKNKSNGNSIANVIGNGGITPEQM